MLPLRVHCVPQQLLPPVRVCSNILYKPTNPRRICHYSPLLVITNQSEPEVNKVLMQQWMVPVFLDLIWDQGCVWSRVKGAVNTRGTSNWGEFDRCVFFGPAADGGASRTLVSYGRWATVKRPEMCERSVNSRHATQGRVTEKLWGSLKLLHQLLISWINWEPTCSLRKWMDNL